MVKKISYQVSKLPDRAVVSYVRDGVQHQVEHPLAGEPDAAFQELRHYRSLPRRERYRLMVKLLQPLLRPHGVYSGVWLPYKYISRLTGVPVSLLQRGRPGCTLLNPTVRWGEQLILLSQRS